MAKLSIQLYTLREEAEKDFEKVLKFVSEQGYEGVEFAGFYGHSKEEVKEWLDRYHLVPTSAHVSIDDLRNDLEGVMEFHKYIGNKHIVCPGYGLNSAETARELMHIFRPMSKTLTENGFQLSYHNHSHELVKEDGVYALDRLYKAFTPYELKLEVDTFWVYAAGLDPVKFLEDRAPYLDNVIHIKDGFDAASCTEEQKALITVPDYMDHLNAEGKYMHPCSIGMGDAPVADIVETACKLGVYWMVLENDNPSPNGFEDVARSTKALKEMIPEIYRNR